jgi:exopolysaccharide biosynthesis predicted pyruvyltransferase EpsI
MTEEAPVPVDALSRSLGQTIDDVLCPLLPPGTPCALLDFPAYSNVGDSAIWLGERAWLAHRGCPVVYACDQCTYAPEHLAERLGNGVILLSGGGNLGDFWVNHQQFRERVIEDFPQQRIIQLPQTIHFLDDWGIGEARRVFNGHRDFTLLCRDEESLRFAQAEFGGTSLLCPDMAFALDPLPVPGPADTDVVWLSRTDAEALASSAPVGVDGVKLLDWLDEPLTPLHERSESLSRQIESHPADWSIVLEDLVATYDAIARERLVRGCRILSQGRAVITDRLHGHVLCLLLGIPHVLLDNNYSKIRRFWQTWTRGCPLVNWASSTAEAVHLARGLAAGRH